ncbi:hypothetical protein IC762_17520 [Bradyrhizobium genosp. L]|uniref:hypothetical protein n=1 Tax=Bradyrhizobium genosp. L TaxID=83637 RepID=UPI0018A24C7E|nr:hypothetical protein [Bradyrhizobium genosp. L]QPF81626.1 hypothetical protein IC762_17520 [Bradyrhizobium genosp. L]
MTDATNDTMEKAFEVAPVTMAQTMSILATSLVATTTCFYKPEDADEHKVIITYLCFAAFFNHLARTAKHKDKMIGVLRAIITDLEEAPDAP